MFYIGLGCTVLSGITAGILGVIGELPNNILIVATLGVLGVILMVIGIFDRLNNMNEKDKVNQFQLMLLQDMKNKRREKSRWRRK